MRFEPLTRLLRTGRAAHDFHHFGTMDSTETKRAMEVKAHRPVLMVPVILTPIVFALVCFFNAMAGSNAGQSIGLFLNNTGDIARLFVTEIQPAGWAFSIWGVIYTWQGLWIVYGLSTLCRRGVDGYLYYSPPVMPVVLYLSYLLNNLLNIGWLLSWDRRILPLALAFLALMTFTLYVCLFASFRALATYERRLVEYGFAPDVWLVRLLVQNGLGIYATWVTIATLLNLGSTLTYDAGVADDVGSTVCLSILTVEIVVWVSLDTFLLDRFTRYLVTPHLVIVFALSAVVQKNYVAGARNSIFSVVLLALGIAALASKVTLLVFRHLRAPNMKVDLTSDVPLATVDDRKYKY